MIPQERLELSLASDLVKQAENLQEQANELLDPIVERIVSTGDIVLIKDLLNNLPRGFYRSEVGTLLNKMEKDRGKD